MSPMINRLGAKSARSFGAFLLTAIRNFFDNFNRTGSSLGGPWTEYNGTWTTDGSNATSATSASSYPLAAVELSSEDIVGEVKSPAPGTGLAFWISDGANWLGVQNYQMNVSYSYTCNCQSGTYSYTCNCLTGSYTYSQCAPTGVFSCSQGVFCGTCGGAGTSANCCNIPGYYTYGCATCFASYTYGCTTCNVSGVTHYIRILRSVAGTVTAIVSQLVSAAIGSIRTILSGNSVTVKAYSATDYTSQIDSDIVTTDSVSTKTTNHGIILGPSAYNQGTTIDEVNFYEQ